jgi:hypothetical protein
MLERAPFVVTDRAPRRAGSFKSRTERTEATDLLILRMDDEVGRTLRADDGDAAAHGLGFPLAQRPRVGDANPAPQQEEEC